MKHTDMRILLRDAFSRVFGRDATTPELQCLQAIASLESSYGEAWKPPGNGSHNFGAIQAGSWTGPTFQYTDTRPNADGTSTPYVTKFRKYATPSDGAVDLVKVVYLNKDRVKNVLTPATAGKSLSFSAGLFATKDAAVAQAVKTKYGVQPTGYFEGFGKTADERIANHHRAVVASIRAQALALDEELPADIEAMPIKPELLRVGSKGATVVALQEQLNRHGATLKADGDFGLATRRAVIAFQESAGLVADGIVGTRTWDALTASAA
jgi:hypothetical protein